MTVAELTASIEPRGRRPVPLDVRTVGEITEADLSLLAGSRGTQPRPIQKLRDRHHALAKALAGGMSVTEASLVTGYDPAWISSLQRVPAFKQLLAEYGSVRDGCFADFQERAAVVTLEALNQIHDTLEEEGEKVSIDQKLEIVKTLADRTGHAPVAKSVQVNATVDLTDRLARARARVIEATVVKEAAE